MVNWANIQRPLTSSHDGKTETPVEIKMWRNLDEYLLFIINHSESKEKVTTTLQIESDGDYIITDLIHNETIKIRCKKFSINS